MKDLVQIGVKLERALWTEIKIKALQEGVTASSIVEAAVLEYMKEPKSKRERIAPTPTVRAVDISGAEKFILDHDQIEARQLATMLNEQGFTTARGGEWNQNTINKVRGRLRKQREG